VFLYIFENKIAERIYTTTLYSILFVTGVACILIILKLLSLIGKTIAKKKWLPLVLKNQNQIFEWTRKVIDNNGLFEEIQNADIEQVIENNFKVVDKRLKQFEELLEIRPKTKDRNERIKIIECYFRK
jgi:hypothetical protein